MASYSVELSRYFKKGARVEINSDDEGFRGSWFLGTVIRPPKDFNKVSAKVLVEYKTLMEDEKGRRPLREELKMVNLRPLPPRESRRTFNFSEEVDAYYNEGWWEGIITEVLENDKYMVFFRGSREQLTFRSSELRLHREWVYGRWVPPLEQTSDGGIIEDEEVPSSAEVEGDNEVVAHNFTSQTSAEVEADNEVVAHNFTSQTSAEVVTDDLVEHNYSAGDLVEVSSDEEGFEGAWFAATIIEKLNRGKYLIEYQDLKDEDDMKLLREEVDATHLRPCPPEVRVVDRFEVLEQVDAFYTDGWWKGVVAKVLKNDRYTIYFEPTDDELKFEHSDLRVHQDWINGKWQIAPKVKNLLTKNS